MTKINKPGCSLVGEGLDCGDGDCDLLIYSRVVAWETMGSIGLAWQRQARFDMWSPGQPLGQRVRVP